MNTDTIFDCVIVGAGIIGATIAHHLSVKAPNWQTALLDRSLVGTGASNYSAGLHIPYGKTSEIKNLSTVSDNEYNMLQSQHDLPIYNVPLIGIASKSKYNEQCSYLYRSGKNIIKNHVLSDDIGQINLGVNEIAFRIEGCHYANVYRLVSHIVNDLRINSQIRIWEGMSVTNIFDDEKIVHLTLQDTRVIRAHNVILAPGPWVKNKLFESILEPFNIRTKKIVALHIDRVPKPQDSALFFFDHDAFLLPLYDRGHWLFSFTCHEWDVFPSSSLNITSEDRNNALAILKKYCPELIKDCVSGRVFCDAYTSNRAPIITKVSNKSNLIFAGAASGSGYRLAPGIANKAISLMHFS